MAKKCGVDVIDLCRKRGDTFPLEVTVKDSSGNAIDITGFDYLLTVDPEEEPADDTNNLFQITGVITNGPGGQVTFPVSSTEADQTPAEYFYDIQQTDTGGVVRTILQGKWEVTQDITKN